MDEKQNRRVEMPFDDAEMPELPDALQKELDKVCGSDVLCGPDPKLEKALDAARREASDLGTALAIRAHLLFVVADRLAVAGDFDADRYAIAARTAEAASRVGSKEDLPPPLWALARYAQSACLRALGGISHVPAEIRRLHARSVEAGEEAVEGLPEHEYPEEWAAAQGNLLVVLRRLAVTEEDDEIAFDMFERAVKAGEEAKRVWTRRGAPREWAKMQNGIAAALMEHADKLDDDDKREPLERAAKALMGALEILDRKANESDWVRAQERLAITRKDQASRESGEKARRLFAASARAFKATIRAYSVAGKTPILGQYQVYLGQVLAGQARYSGDKGAERIKALAVEAFEAALEIFTPQKFPAECQECCNELAGALQEMAANSKGKKALRLYHRSVEALEKGLGADPRQSDTPLRGSMMFGLARTLHDMSRLGQEEDAPGLVHRAIETGEKAVRIFDKVGVKRLQGMSRFTLGVMIRERSYNAANFPEARADIEKAIRLYEESLRFFDGSVDFARTRIEESIGQMRAELARLADA